MSKKLKVLISAVVVALLLTVGATATVMAQGEEEEQTTPTSEEAGGKGLLERVAEILGMRRKTWLMPLSRLSKRCGMKPLSTVLIKPWERGALLKSRLMKS